MSTTRSGLSFSEMFQWVLLFTSIGTIAHLLIGYHTKWVYHSEQRHQYEALATSQLCKDDKLRVQSAEVNNCAIADRAVKGGMLSPAVLALLQTLQELSLCSSDNTHLYNGQPNHLLHTSSQNRCDLVIKAIIDSSLKVLILAILLLVALVWFLKQYAYVIHARNTKLPLEDPNYPVPGHMAPWFKEALLKED